MRYCFWRLETVGGKEIKKPYGYDEFQGIVASKWNEYLLPSYTEAKSACPAGYKIGFYIEPPYVAIDLDDTTDHPLLQAAPKECYKFPSISGSGWHIIGTFQGELPQWKNQAGLEMYSDKRFIAATAPDKVEMCDTDITALVYECASKYLQGSPTTSTSTAVAKQPSVDEKIYQAAIAALNKCSPDAPYEDWMRSITAVANSFTGTEWEAKALKECVRWSKQSPKYDSNALIHIRRYFKEAQNRTISDVPKVTVATLFHQHPECIPAEDITESFDAIEAAETSEAIEVPQNSKLSYVHDVGLVVRELRDMGLFSVGGKEYFQHDGQKWEVIANDFNYLLRVVKEYIVAKGYNWYRGKGGMAYTEKDCVKGHTVLAQALRECLAVKQSFPINSWMNPAVEKSTASYLPVQNGIIEITKSSVTLLPPNIGFFNLAVTTTQWNGESSTVGHPVELEQGLLRTFGGEKAAVDMWYNVMGLCLLHKIFCKKLFLIQGASNAGKGQLTELLALLVGESAVATSNEALLTGAFGFADLDRASVCVLDELDTSYMSRALRNALKTLTSGGLVTMNQKMVKPRNAYVTAKVFITTNDTVEALRDPHGGLRHRLVCFNVAQVGEQDRVYNWARTVWKQEGPQILALAVSRAQRILAEGVGIIRTPEGAGELLMQDIEEASIDPIVHWLKNKYTFAADSDKGISVQAILAGYLATEHEKSTEHKYWMSQSKSWQGRNVAKKVLEAFPKAVVKKQKSGRKVYGLVEIPQFQTDV